MRKIEAVFFDLDGTLLDRSASVLKFIEDQYERFRPQLSLIDKQLYKNRFIELDARGYVWKDKVYSQLLQELNIASLTWEELLEDYIINFKNSSIGFPNLHAVLGKLRQMGIKLCLISNGKTLFQMANIKALGIEGYFDSILISEAVGLRKPDIRIFHKGMEDLSVSASRSIFVGDHPENDVKASRSTGMIGIWKRDDYWDRAEADFTIDELVELLGIIQTGAEEHDQFSCFI
ncbi:HAD family hydrolase [Mesobacillus boroniphilus]|uniref:HAD family hydrolase n=1 Tax=Mesobacillus boroniphilus TaxID=308892 RepID=A0A944CMP0_9BACI|nr:HAD family hydrolase [Mesobacillus boroniphilus]MBS8265830.1 HAD family hydrolase [Mesobacillus boroniphilus]